MPAEIHAITERTPEDEMHAWQQKVENFMEDSIIQRRIAATQMGALERTVFELKGDVQESNEWSKKNHDTLITVVEFFQGLENLRKLADTAMRWGKPIAWLAGMGIAGIAIAKGAIGAIATHLPNWIKW